MASKLQCGVLNERKNERVTGDAQWKWFLCATLSTCYASKQCLMKNLRVEETENHEMKRSVLVFENLLHPQGQPYI